MKKFGKILAMVMVALMMMSVVAMAEEAVEPAEPIEATVGDDAFVTVVLSGLTKGEEATILVVNDIRIVETEETDDNGEKVKVEETVELASLKNTDIVYIDQLTVGDDGTVAFELDASKTVANLDGKQLVDIYCGYTSMNVGDEPLHKFGVDINPVVAPEYIYGDADNDGDVDGTDAIVILEIALGEAYDGPIAVVDVDCNGSVEGTDAIMTLEFALGDTSVILGPSRENN